MNPFQSTLRWLSREVYGGLVPTTEPLQGAETYLIDLWKRAPFRVAATHTALAIAVLVLPLFVLGKLRLFPQLSRADKAEMQKRMARSPRYLFRLIFYGVRGHALVASLRDPLGRKSLLPRLERKRVAS